MKEIYRFRPILGKSLFKWFAYFYLNFKAFTAYRFNNLSSAIEVSDMFFINIFTIYEITE